MRKEEIQLRQLDQYSAELQGVLEVICTSPAFRTSPKSCEFLRHIVHHALSGDIEVLKERLIGIALLGRQAAYDTGSDAGVRVRANDVRKRLLAYHASAGNDIPFTLDLPAGSYVPRFFRNVELRSELPELVDHSSPVTLPEPVPPLTLQQRAMPTLIALFLCAICMRWQLTQEHPFTTFWQTVFEDHHAILYVAPSRGSSGQELLPMGMFEAAAPLLTLAGRFHTELTVSRTAAPAAPANEIVITIGSGPGETMPMDNARLAIRDTPNGAEIVDRDAANKRLPIGGSAALLTIANGMQRSIRIDGTDDRAIGALIKTLCERDNFPEDLTDMFQEGTVTQMVFPIMPHTASMVFRGSLSDGRSAVTRTQ